MGMRLQVLIVQPRTILRDGLCALVDAQPDMSVVAAVADTATAAAVMSELQPAVVVTDLVVGGESGYAWIGTMRALHPDSHILVLASHHREEYIRAALTAGASGYVTKDSEAREFVSAIRAVGAGLHFLCRAVQCQVVAGFVRPSTRHDSAGPSITPREREVLLRIARGGTSAAIALELDVDVRTVERHRANLMRKLTVHSTTELRRLATRCGLDADCAAPDADGLAPEVMGRKPGVSPRR